MGSAFLEVMECHSREMRGERPFVFATLISGQDTEIIVRFIESQGLMQ
jgi:Ni2+-binding GTPase involved in maturation of urease and hydrogenase